jgi:hypothetical protein
LLEVELALVVLRQPGGDGRDGEQQGGHSHEGVAHRADVHDGAHVLSQPQHHVAAELDEASLEQLGVVVGGVLDRASPERRHEVGAAPSGLWPKPSAERSPTSMGSSPPWHRAR